eukprot:CAMPEP_0173415880 /NCGR_PEP_ID=MMETSP1356-20130122/85099_1 /TAXON_ID=77927 ORGANISM="Hemiselmis virescens, Strain PCC157" /NCGR_SAMPLE_ID=MMETSP1356 /ASSEMBLY_ACC=CAM_ASM_000847 /LENGTH=152 /DNA_ID=CAMNT_0014378163 /DNA_START=549 /DNA_END=1005 /DNA_ORIENTATION=-
MQRLLRQLPHVLLSCAPQPPIPMPVRVEQNPAPGRQGVPPGHLGVHREAPRLVGGIVCGPGEEFGSPRDQVKLRHRLGHVEPPSRHAAIQGVLYVAGPGSALAALICFSRSDMLFLLLNLPPDIRRRCTALTPAGPGPSERYSERCLAVPNV